ncbi:MAG: hypothetical protein V3V82_00620 [Acidimicrobiia bacterium]
MPDPTPELPPAHEIELLLLLRRTLLEIPSTIEILRQQISAAMLPTIPTMLDKIQQRLAKLAPDDHHHH